MTISFLTHSQGGRNGTGFQTVTELVRDQQNSYGWLELVEFIGGLPADVKITPSGVFSSFSHIGIIAPDILQLQQHVQDEGFEVLRHVGDGHVTVAESRLAEVYGLQALAAQGHADVAELVFGVLTGSNAFFYAVDPDGNTIEVIPVDNPPLFD